jgi:hypothetical protein
MRLGCWKFCKLIWRHKKLHAFKEKRPNVFAKRASAYLVGEQG